MIRQAKKIRAMIGAQARRQLVWIFCLMVAAALLETVGIGLFIPLLQILTSPESYSHSPTMSYLLEASGIAEPQELIVVFCIVLSLFFLTKGVSLGFIIYMQNRYITKNQAVFARELLEIYLSQPYEFHLRRNTMELVRNITLLSVRVFVKGLLPLLQLAMEIMVITGIAAVLLYIDPISTLMMGALLGSAVSCFYLLIRTRISHWGQNTVRLDGDLLIWINQALGSIKETKLYGHEPFFVRAFRLPALERAGYLARSITAPQLPRLFIEAVAIGSIAIMVAYLVSRPDTNTATIIPTLGLFGIAAMRLMPSLSKIVSAITTFRENTAAIDIIYDDFCIAEATRQNPVEQTAQTPANRVTFSDRLELKNIGYTFPSAPTPIFEGLTLSIKHGASVAFVGASGAGKTTLIDLILGLLEPTEGQITVDGQDVHNHIRGWQSLIGYIPQDVYILDDSLRRNVALGQNDADIDDNRLRKALNQAQLGQMVDDLPDGLETPLGQNGSRLSGGQRQRIGIARALYHEPQVLVMDEATSALDSETEKEIAAAIQKLSGEKTILIIAHRLSTVRHCDEIVLLDKGKIVDAGSFSHLEASNAHFKRLIELSSLKKETETDYA